MSSPLSTLINYLHLYRTQPLTLLIVFTLVTSEIFNDLVRLSILFYTSVKNILITIHVPQCLCYQTVISDNVIDE